MYKIKNILEGIVPYGHNPYNSNTQGKGKIAEEEREEIAKQNIYKNKEGCFIPARHFKACLLQGCGMAGLKYGKKGLYPYLNGAVFIDPLEIPLHKDTYDFIYKRMGRVPPKTGGLVPIYTACFNAGWSVSFNWVVMDDRLSAKQIKEAIEQGGLLVGIGNNRPEYGRFIIKEWEVNKDGNR